MQQELRLPWSAKEGLLFGAIIALITAFIMSNFAMWRMNNGLTLDIFLKGLIAWPVVACLAMLVMTFVVGKIANRIVNTVLEPTDGFYAHVIVNIVCCVTMMSMIFTFLGEFTGTAMSGNMDVMETLSHWPQNWPVNFCVAFWVEMFVAQPAARWVMKKKHIAMIAKQEAAQ